MDLDKNVADIIKHIKLNNGEVIDDLHHTKRKLDVLGIYTDTKGKQYLAPLFEGIVFSLVDMYLDGEMIAHISKVTIGGFTIDSRLDCIEIAVVKSGNNIEIVIC